MNSISGDTCLCSPFLLLFLVASILAFGHASFNTLEAQVWEEPSLLIFGSVVLEGDKNIGEIVSVELVCNTVVTRQVYTDYNGFFKIQFGKGAQDTAFSDLSASYPGGGLPYEININDSVNSVSSVIPNMDHCELRVFPVPGFKSDPVSTHDFKGRFPTGNVGKIILEPVTKIRGTRISLTSGQAPEKARKSYFKAKELVRQDKPDVKKALKELDKSVELFPEFAAAWNLKAEIHKSQKKMDAARDAFEKAQKADPNFIPPYFGLAWISADDSQWSQTLQLTGELRELGVITAETYYLEGMSYYYQGDLERSKESFLLLDPRLASARFPLALLHLAIIHCVHGEIEESLHGFKSYLTALPSSSIPASHRERIRQQMNEWLQKGLITSEQATLDGLL